MTINTKTFFLMIGAMKAGTTTLYKILEQCNDIYMPSNKEPESLTSDYIYTHKSQYYKLLGVNRSEKCLGEASTAYAKYPSYENVPQRAIDILGKNLKVIYLVRDPVIRAISHINHDLALNRIEPNQARSLLFQDPKYSYYSNYPLQLSKWLERIERKNIRVIKFEDLIQNPRTEVQKLCAFLDISEKGIKNYSIRANQSKDKLVTHHLFRAAIESEVYRNWLKSLLPFSVILPIKKILSRPKKVVELNLTQDEVARFLDACDGHQYSDFPQNIL